MANLSVRCDCVCHEFYREEFGEDYLCEELVRSEDIVE